MAGASRERSHGFATEGKTGASPTGSVAGDADPRGINNDASPRGNTAGDADPRGSNNTTHKRKPSPK